MFSPVTLLTIKVLAQLTAFLDTSSCTRLVAGGYSGNIAGCKSLSGWLVSALGKRPKFGHCLINATNEQLVKCRDVELCRSSQIRSTCGRRVDTSGWQWWYKLVHAEDELNVAESTYYFRMVNQQLQLTVCVVIIVLMFT